MIKTKVNLNNATRFFTSEKFEKFLDMPVSELSKDKNSSYNISRVRTILESKTGRNILFLDSQSNKIMYCKQFVNEIKAGRYTNYHIRKINNIDTPVSNPDSLRLNNLG